MSTTAPVTAESLYAQPNALAGHYRRFRVAERLLLTGHSHQAWPDCSEAGQAEAWHDAADHVDAKWDRAFAKAREVREGYAQLLDDRADHIALGANTHELVIRFLSALPLAARPRLVTTDGEFHTLRRQLDRLAEEHIEVVKVNATPVGTLSERVAAAVDDRTAAVLMSCVLFQNAQIVDHLSAVRDACRLHGAAFLVDAYHALNIVPFSLIDVDLSDAFVIGGGYKYCQLGEGNCFLRVPPGRDYRPAVTGWFAEFSLLHRLDPSSRVQYPTGAEQFAGATYDPTSHYRAASVFQFFRDRGLSVRLLREVSQHQVGLLASGFDALDLPPNVVHRDRAVPLEGIGGFLALTTMRAGELHAALKQRGVSTDYRGNVLRLGPAPYLCDAQIKDAITALGESVKEIDRVGVYPRSGASGSGGSGA